MASSRANSQANSPAISPANSQAEFRFLHCSDLHLGKAFGNFDEDTRGELQQARRDLLARLAVAASEGGAQHVLVAGDMFDTETPSDRILRQALTAMAESAPLQWWIIPGNHDSASAATLWQQLQDHAPDNVHLLLEPAVVALAPGVQLLPAPCLHRFPGVDLTGWMDAAETPEGDLRIGLAHGAVLDFDGEAPGQGTIAPNRAVTANLDYLALGDWHGAMTLNDRTRYSGTPERDRFKHQGPGQALLVTLSPAGAAPKVEERAIGRFDWQVPQLTLTPDSDVTALLQQLLPDRSRWRHMLVRLQVDGWLALPQRLQLQQEVARLAPEFCFFELDDSGLNTECRSSDLEQIASGGALRVAAETLQQQAEDAALSKPDRDIAAAALNRLYALSQE